MNTDPINTVIDFQQLGESTSDQIIMFDSYFRLVYLNSRAEQMLARPKVELIGQLWWEVVPNCEGTAFANQCRRAMIERISADFQEYDPIGRRWNEIRCIPEDSGGLIVVIRDATREHIAEAARDEAVSLLKSVINGTTDMVAAVNRDRRFLLANPAVARFMGYESPDDLLGKTDFELLPDAANQEMLQRVKELDDAVLRSGEASSYEFHTEVTPDGRGPRTFVSSKGPLRHHETGEIIGLVNIIHDITDRKRAENRLRRLFDSRVVGVIFWNLETGLITDANETFLTMVGYTRGDLENGLLDFRKMTPPEWSSRNEQGVSDIYRYGSARPYEKEYFHKDGSRIPILIGGTRFDDSSVEGYSYIVDITERKFQEERERTRLAAIFQQAPAFMAALNGPDHVFELANPSYMQLVGNRAVLGKPVRDALPEVVDQGFIELLNQVYLTGEPFSGKGVRLLLRETPSGPLRERFLDFVYQPLYGTSGEVTGILAHGIDITDRKVLQNEQDRLLVEQSILLREARALADREALINQIGDGIRQALAPQEIERIALAAVGNHLRADRCYLMTIDTDRDSFTITRIWSSNEENVMAGNYNISEMAQNFAGIFTATDTVVVSDCFLDERCSPLTIGNGDNQHLSARSFLHVPLYEDDRIIGSLGVAMIDDSRQWTVEEVTLAETVAGQLRSVVEAARLQQRERNIAQQLQESLQPVVPDHFPGLILASHYRAALDEAQVGGDFSDAFPLSNSKYALVVADLSGKGLDAASQVALVRNQLRYALYTADLNDDNALATSVQTLNNVLAEHELLTGFATLFVGVWDPNTNTLSYVNAGQEPGLLWRAESQSIEELPPTGPILGGFAGGVFKQRAVTLYAGDLWIAFSDGMTEIGPNRKEMLGIEGLIPLFAGVCADVTGKTSREDLPRVILSRLLNEIDAFSRNTGMRDDLCVLIGLCDAI